MSCVYLKHKIHQPLYNVYVKIGAIVMLLGSVILFCFLFKPGLTKLNSKMPNRSSLNVANMYWRRGAIVQISWPYWLMSPINYTQSELGEKCSWFPLVFHVGSPDMLAGYFHDYLCDCGIKGSISVWKELNTQEQIHFLEFHFRATGTFWKHIGIS